ncbi:KaiA domain protein [Cylindrospermum stagnale PCC 7417]|uniref:Circadian clock oscillator protein KaiA n=1 Tax=Cylindrospermum stagnale PCC 7417 TaxID=56107 RepID=K9WYL6_9NOST|nr:KaiA domain protein [Cylindrospermum stagnale]AFZ25465.1 KaiA domain protein [Cylindrospermum stagnale PCC 7417]
MLLPILILQPDVKKKLNHSTGLAAAQSLIGQMWNLIDATIYRLHYMLVATATPAKIGYSPKWVPPKPHQQLTDKYAYVLACYKPKNQQYFQQMSQMERQELLHKIKSDYRDILINYFTTDKTLKEKIDKFINALFYANIPVPQIIEVHMEVIDEFSKQLRLEGRSDESLLDYRLTLIDILAHLCEIYRSSISK